jgi:hypothetical protein
MLAMATVTRDRHVVAVLRANLAGADAWLGEADHANAVVPAYHTDHNAQPGLKI